VCTTPVRVAPPLDEYTTVAVPLRTSSRTNFRESAEAFLFSSLHSWQSEADFCLQQSTSPAKTNEDTQIEEQNNRTSLDLFILINI
jgi:hypothetical protein